jgi:hypothetical protein
VASGRAPRENETPAPWPQRALENLALVAIRTRREKDLARVHVLRHPTAPVSNATAFRPHWTTAQLKALRAADRLERELPQVTDVIA